MIEIDANRMRVARTPEEERRIQINRDEEVIMNKSIQKMYAQFKKIHGISYLKYIKFHGMDTIITKFKMKRDAHIDKMFHQFLEQDNEETPEDV